MTWCFTKPSDDLALNIGAIASKLVSKTENMKWAVFVDIIGTDIQQTFSCLDMTLTADFVSITGSGITTSMTGSVSTILNRSGVVNDGKVKDIDLNDAIKSVQQTAEPLVIGKAHKYHGQCCEGSTDWVESALMVPVLLQGVVYGVLRMYSDKKKAFKKDHVTYATIIGRIIQSYLSSNSSTKLLRMSMQTQGPKTTRTKVIALPALDTLGENDMIESA